jgi:hypothetical protein
MLSFDAQVYQNEYLPERGDEVNAIVTVTAHGRSPEFRVGRSRAPAAEIIILDCSTSMNYPATKMQAAKHATAVAIDALRTGVHFAVVAGTHEASVCFPNSGGLVPATPVAKAAARRAVARLGAGGGTAIGRWLRLTNRLFAAHGDAIRHAILLTDGRDESETPAELASALSDCVGGFTCDCRGVGTDWSVDELRRIGTALLGSVDIVASPGGLAADFARMMMHSMDKAVADVALRVWTPLGADVRFLKQVAPEMRDLTGTALPAAVPQARDYPTGSWGEESRDYHLCVAVRPGELGDEMLAARLSVISDGDVRAKGLVRAIWTDDQARSTRIDEQVAHFTGQAELAQAVQEGLRARRAGDVVTATARLGRAIALATASGHADTAKLLRQVVDVDDPVTGTVRLKPYVEDADEMALDTRSTKTIRSRSR